MDCARVQTWLLEADDPRPEACSDVGLVEHLRACPECQSLSSDLLRLEAAWRGIPLPVHAEQSRADFLNKLPVKKPVLRTRRLFLSRLAAAAALLLSAGALTWLMLFTPTDVSASDDLVAQLLDWNLELTQAPKIEERTRIYAAHAEALQKDLAHASLGPEERQLAEQLLANGRWLAQNADPVAEAERFSEVADALARRLGTAAEQGDVTELDRVGSQYRQAALGIDASLRRAASNRPLPHSQKLRERDQTRKANMRDLMTRISPPAQHTLRDALEGHGKSPKHGKGQKKKGTR